LKQTNCLSWTYSAYLYFQAKVYGIRQCGHSALYIRYIVDISRISCVYRNIREAWEWSRPLFWYNR